MINRTFSTGYQTGRQTVLACLALLTGHSAAIAQSEALDPAAPGLGQLAGDKARLSLAAVEVGGQPQETAAPISPTLNNLAIGKPTAQRSVRQGKTANRAVDGKKDTFTRTRRQKHPWWQVDLQTPSDIKHIILRNRSDCCQGRLHNVTVFIARAPFATASFDELLATDGVVAHHLPWQLGPETRIDLPANTQGRYVRVQLSGKKAILSLAEVEIFGSLTGSGQDGNGIPDDQDNDRDGDGVNNDQDAFPDDPGETQDLDGDGIGDNSDPDRDGDGFSNGQEVAAGTDPNEPLDYIDAIAPQVVILTPDNHVTNAAEIALDFTASDEYSGLQSIVINNSNFPGLDFGVPISGHHYSERVPLNPGLNTLSVRVIDRGDNLATDSIQVERRSPPSLPPQLENLTPASGSIVTTATVTIRGSLRTTLPMEAFQLEIDSWSLTAEKAGDDLYTFELPDYRLQVGTNSVPIHVNAESGDVSETLTLIYHPPGGAQPAPTITLYSPSAGTYYSGDNLKVIAQVQLAAPPAQSATLNGHPFVLNASGYINETLRIDGFDDSVTVTVKVTDALGKVGQASAEVSLDQIKPTIHFNGGLLAPPHVNTINTLPFELSGQVTDPRLVSIRVDGQGINPERIKAGQYAFKAELDIAIGEQQRVSVSAKDAAGNLSRREVILDADISATIEPISPQPNTTYERNNALNEIDLVVRLSSVPEGAWLSASLNGIEQRMPLTGRTGRARIALPQENGSYSIGYRLQNNQGGLLSQTRVPIKLQSQEESPVKLARFKPANGSQRVEPYEAIALYFNRPIDLALLDIKVLETVHGKTYTNNTPLGSNQPRADNYQQAEVHRERQVISGTLEGLPGSRLVSFDASRRYAYNATVYVSVHYDGQALEHFRFDVRSLPTWVTGFVIDQFDQPIPGIPLKIAALNWETTTDPSGRFQFSNTRNSRRVFPEGTYEITLNPAGKVPFYGTIVRRFSIQKGRKNALGSLKLMQRDDTRPMEYISAGQPVLSLHEGNVILDKGKAAVVFADGATAGGVHVQLLDFSSIPVPVAGHIVPTWLYAVQPQGVRVDGAFTLKLGLPRIDGARNDVFDEDTYMMILAYDPALDVIRPVEVGRVTDGMLESINPVQLNVLDFLGYGFSGAEQQAILKRYAAGEINWLQLLAEF